MNTRHLKIFPLFLFFLFSFHPVFASEDIAHTKHNLAVNPDIVAASSTTINVNGDICVFCHTPHGGRTDVAGGGAPLWNRRLPATAANSYTIYDSPNFDKAGGITHSSYCWSPDTYALARTRGDGFRRTSLRA